MALGVSRPRVQQLVRAGRLKTDPAGHVMAASVLALLAERAAPPAAGPPGAGPISQAAAAQRLGVGKTRVQQFLASGRLGRLPDGSVDPGSLAQLIAERARGAGR